MMIETLLSMNGFYIAGGACLIDGRLEQINNTLKSVDVIVGIILIVFGVGLTIAGVLIQLNANAERRSAAPALKDETQKRDALTKKRTNFSKSARKQKIQKMIDIFLL